MTWCVLPFFKVSCDVVRKSSEIQKTKSSPAGNQVCFSFKSPSCDDSDLDAGGKILNLHFSQVCLYYLAFLQVFSCSLALLPFGLV